MQLHFFVDANHASNKVTRISRAGILKFLNRAPGMWYSKWNNMVERSLFGSEFFSIKTEAEMIRELRYKIKILEFLWMVPKMCFVITNMYEIILRCLLQHLIKSILTYVITLLGNSARPAQ